MHGNLRPRMPAFPQAFNSQNVLITYYFIRLPYIVERFSKVISRSLWFCITTLCVWLTKLAPLSPTNGALFPALGASYMYLLRLLIGSLCCLHLLRLARVITLVLVLRHSIGNRSILRLICLNSKWRPIRVKGAYCSSRRRFLSFQIVVSVVFSLKR